jgi:hypothetical protein
VSDFSQLSLFTSTYTCFFLLLNPQSRYNYAQQDTSHPKSTRAVLLGSLGSFMIYFFVLREENDIDEMIYQPVWKTVPELEIPLFEYAVKQHRELNAPYAELEAHLKQALERREQQLKNQSGSGGVVKN